MNDYQIKVLNSEMFFERSAISNIGGTLILLEDISYSVCYQILHEMICKLTGLRLQLNRKMELYEHKEDDYDISRVYIKGGFDEAMEYVQNSMKIPFAQLYDNPLFDIQIIEYNNGKMIFLKLHHLLGDAASISILCKLFDDGVNAIREGRVYKCEDVSAVYTPISNEKRTNAKKYFEKN